MKKEIEINYPVAELRGNLFYYKITESTKKPFDLDE